MNFKLELVKQPSFELSFSNLVVRGVDPSDTTATEEDVFADATFYAGNITIKTGVLDPILEYEKTEDLYQYVLRGTPLPSEEEYAEAELWIYKYIDRIFEGVLINEQW